MLTGRTVVIGVGDPYRRDHGLGPAVVSLLYHRHLPRVELAACDGELHELIGLWADASLAVVVETVRTRRHHPGRVHRLAAHHPSAPPFGQHGDVGEAVRLARALGRLPVRLVLFAVEASDTGPGRGLSAEVADAAVALTDEIADLVSTGPAPSRVA